MRGALWFGLLVGTLTAQLSGTYTVDPNGTGSRNFRSLRAAVAALGAGVSGPVVFQVKPATYQGFLVLTPVPGASSVRTVTFVTPGTQPAVVDAAGGSVGLFLFDGTQWVNFTHFKVRNFQRFGLYLFGFSPGPGVQHCTFTRVEMDAPAAANSLVNAVRIEYSANNVFRRCVFRGGGWTLYSQMMQGNVFDGCEFDGKGQASWVIAPFNRNDADNVFQNCFVHDCSPSGYGIYMNLSSYGNMMWHNTVIVNTTAAAVWMGSCCAWSRASSWRNNLIVNLGSGTAVVYGETLQKKLKRFDADYNAYYAPNSKIGVIRTEQNTYRGSLKGWLQFLSRNPGMIQSGGGKAYDQNSLEADPKLVRMQAPYDIHLTPVSPLLDAGTSRYVAGPWISFNAQAKVLTDFEGEPRGPNPDIGADEVVARISGPARASPGTAVTFILQAPADGGLTYQVGTSATAGRIPVGQRFINLGFDSVLLVSVRGILPWIFRQYTGGLTAQGLGQAQLALPADTRLKGVKLYTAFVTLQAGAPFYIKSISNAHTLTIQ